MQEHSQSISVNAEHSLVKNIDSRHPARNPEVWTTIDLGDSFACGTTTFEGYCWGDQLPSINFPESAQTQVNDPQHIVNPPGVSSWRQLVAGGHVCGIANNNQSYCFGLNSFGQLGNGTTTSSVTPVAVLIEQPIRSLMLTGIIQPTFLNTAVTNLFTVHSCAHFLLCTH